MFAKNSVKAIRTVIQKVNGPELQRLPHHPLKPPTVSPTRKAVHMAAHDDITSDLSPPAAVRGMLTLDRSLFARTARVSCLLVDQRHLQKALKLVKPFMLKLERFSAVQKELDVEAEMKPKAIEKEINSNNVTEFVDDSPKSLEGSGVNKPEVINSEIVVDTQKKIAQTGDGKVIHKRILLNPRTTPPIFADLQTAVRDGLSELGVTTFHYRKVSLDYGNWKCEEILHAVLPPDRDGTTAYSRVGHIVHLNLREHLTDYRHLIGAVLLDKLAGVKLVVNKLDAIGNEFRFFQMEVLAGEGSMETTVKENGCTFKFDFAKVFWNPRLCTEHGRLVERLPRGSVLYDVFAGVGPFAVPAARSKRCRVLANDLNPDSYHWLCNNVTTNRVSDRVVTHKQDGRLFLRTTVRDDITREWRRYVEARAKFGQEDEDVSVTPPDLNVVMNLPALAVEFLDAFVGLLAGPETDVTPEMVEREVMVHCYTFAKEEEFETSVPALVEAVLGCRLDRDTTETFHVRSVAPNKEMIRISFRMPNAVLFRNVNESALILVDGSESGVIGGEPPAKKLCTELPLLDSRDLDI